MESHCAGALGKAIVTEIHELPASYRKEVLLGLPVYRAKNRSRTSAVGSQQSFFPGRDQRTLEQLINMKHVEERPVLS